MVQKKLTLRMEAEVIRKAKRLAGEKGDSVSKMTERYFRNLTEQPVPSDNTPLVAQLRGCIKSGDREDYKDHLRKKYS